MERLDKTVSKAASVSRSDARGFVLRGKVTVNGDVVRDIGFKVDPEKDKIELEGKAVTYKKFCYIVMNKPKGVLSASEDSRAETVVDLLPERYSRRKLFPVGRLDKDTTGLLLITDDGDFAHTLLSPNKKIPKEYIAILDGNVDDGIAEGFESGVTLADGTVLAPAYLEICEKANIARVRITEGKYHQIKRMFGVFGLGVNELKRVGFAGMSLPVDLKEGEFRELTDDEIAYFTKIAGIVS